MKRKNLERFFNYHFSFWERVKIRQLISISQEGYFQRNQYRATLTKKSASLYKIFFAFLNSGDASEKEMAIENLAVMPYFKDGLKGMHSPLEKSFIEMEAAIQRESQDEKGNTLFSYRRLFEKFNPSEVAELSFRYLNKNRLSSSGVNLSGSPYFLILSDISIKHIIRLLDNFDHYYLAEFSGFNEGFKKSIPEIVQEIILAHFSENAQNLKKQESLERSKKYVILYRSILKDRLGEENYEMILNQIEVQKQRAA